MYKIVKTTAVVGASYIGISFAYNIYLYGWKQYMEMAKKVSEGHSMVGVIKNATPIR
jgi:hypothetical protein